MVLTMHPFVNVVEFGDKKFKGYTLIEGFPGMGLVGTIAAKYLIDKMKFSYDGYIDSNTFMPIVRIHKGVPLRPARIYSLESKKLVIIISEQVIAKPYVRLFADTITQWIQKKGFASLISLSGIHSYDSTQNVIYGIAANDESVDLLKKHGLEVIEDGITTGITAIMLLELKKTNIQAISILGNVKNAADYQAAAEILKKLSEIIELKVDVGPLLEEAKELEKELVSQMKKLQETKDSVEKFEPHPQMFT